MSTKNFVSNGDAETLFTGIGNKLSTLKSGLTTLDNEVNGDAVTYPYADVITIEDAVPANLADCKLKLEPVQDLHGYDHPWVGGAGKNLVPLVLDSIKTVNTDGTWNGNTYTVRGIDYTILLDDAGNIIGIDGNGTCDTNWAILKIKNIPIKAGNYLLSGATGGTTTTYRIDIIVDGVTTTNTNGDTAVTVSSDTTCEVDVTVRASGTVLNNQKFYPMLRDASITDATFAPYTNICTISGHTEASVSVTGASVVSISQFSAGTGTTVIKEGNTAIMTCDALDMYRSVDIGNPGNLILPKGTYRVSFDIDSIEENNCRFGFRGSDYGFKALTLITGTGHYTDVLTISENCYISVLLSGATPQTNRLVMSNLFVSKIAHTYTISLGDTIYGGTVDFDSGVMTVDRATATVTTLARNTDNSFYQAISPTPKANQTNISQIICDRATTGDRSNINTVFINASSNLRVNTAVACSTGAEAIEYYGGSLTVCYELATPTTIQLTPQQIQLLQGRNTLTASTGQISVTVNGVSGSIGAVQEQVNATDEALAELADKLPTAPTTDGAYVLTVTVADGTPTYSWESAT